MITYKVPAKSGSKFKIFNEIRLVGPGSDAPEDQRLKHQVKIQMSVILASGCKENELFESLFQEREFIQIHDSMSSDKLLLMDELLKGTSDDLEAVGMLWCLIEDLCEDRT